MSKQTTRSETKEQIGCSFCGRWFANETVLVKHWGKSPDCANFAVFVQAQQQQYQKAMNF